jgi:hypothetical protein
MLNYVLVTSDRYTEEETAELYGGIIRSDLVDHVKPYQTIFNLSEMAKNRGLKIGQLVMINFDKAPYCRPVQAKAANSVKESEEHYRAKLEYNIPTMEIGGVEYLKIFDSDIEFIIDNFEFKEKQVRGKGLIMPDKRLIKSVC